MQSVSPSGRLDLEGAGIRAAAWTRVRGSMSEGRFFTIILVVLLAFNIARSTATFHWVNGIEVVTPIAVLGALVLGALALTPLREPIALGIGLVLAAPVAVLGAWPQIHLVNRTAVLGPQLLDMWWRSVRDGTITNDQSFFLVLICVLMWITGGWLAWCVLRWRKPMLGLIPGAAAFATNLLNILPGDSDQNGYTLGMLVLTIALLLWTNYNNSIANAVRAHVKLTGDARWDFWESGLVAMTALIVLAIFLPQLSTADRTLDLENGMFSSWAQLQQQLSHPGFITSSRGGPGTTGFTDEVRLSGPLQRTRDPVFMYTLIGESGGPRYFRGVNETITLGSEWRYPGATTRVTLLKNETVSYGESYDSLGIAGYTVKMLRPPVGYADVLFYPGQLLKVDRASSAQQVQLARGAGGLMSIDRLGSMQPVTSAGSYVVYSEYSDASAAQLQSAGTNYPNWVRQFGFIPVDGYRPPDVLTKIRTLALQVTAGATTPYDKATAIENYLRDTSKFTYTLDPPKPADGGDPIDNFLFNTHKGYCEYFATAMGDMLRSLGIPTRLVNGYGPGNYDSQTNNYVVRGDDAHTWVEVYFPSYGWIPFEPTADGVYQTIVRGQNGSNLCLRDAGCESPTGGVVPVLGGTTATPRTRDRNDPSGGPATGGLSVTNIIDASTLTKVVAVLLAMLLLALAAAARYLRPRTVMGVWRRTVTLADLAGAERKPGETPLELSRRLQRSFPEAAEPVDTLTKGFVVAAYAPPDMASSSRSSVLDAWTTLRPMLLRRVLARLRPTRT